MVYAVSDLHGYSLSKFEELLEQVNFSKDDFLYVLGDVIDRGKDGINLLKWMMSKHNVQLILGNHEAMMLACDFLFEEITPKSISDLTGAKLQSYSVWLSNGARPTVEALSSMRNNEIQYILEYLREAPFYEALTVNGKDFLLCHSGLDNFEQDKKLSAYSPNDFIWTRPSLDQRYFDDIFMVFGHTPTVYLDEKFSGKAVKTDTWINIDVGAGIGFDPVLFRLDDMTEIYKK